MRISFQKMKSERQNQTIRCVVFLSLFTLFSCDLSTGPTIQVISPDLTTTQTLFNYLGQPCKEVSKDGLDVLDYKYSSSYYLGSVATFYFENVGSSGDFDFAIMLTGGKTPTAGSTTSATKTIAVAEGKSYALRVNVHFDDSMSTQYAESVLHKFDIVWSSSSSQMAELSFEAPARGASLGGIQLIELADLAAVPEAARERFALYPVKVMEFNGAFQLRERLRGQGFDASLQARGDGWLKRSLDYQGVRVGKAVPADAAAQVIGIAREQWPFLSYVIFSGNDSEVYLGGATGGLVEHCVRPWTEEEFSKLEAGITLEDFHALIESHIDKDPKLFGEQLRRYPIEVSSLSDMSKTHKLVARLERLGFSAFRSFSGDIIFLDDTREMGGADDLQSAAITVGRKVPVDVAVLAIRTAREEWPFLSYIDFSMSETDIFIGASTKAEKRRLRQWTDDEFAGLDPEMSLPGFHELIRKHHQN